MSFADAIAGAFAALQNAAGVVVTLQRGAQETADVTAVPGKRQALLAGTDGSVTEQRTRDFLIDVNDYQFDDLRCEPRAGDLIVEETADGALVYELRPFGGEPAARYVDESTRGQWRCHVQLVDEQLEGVLGNEHGQMLTTEDGTPLEAEGS